MPRAPRQPNPKATALTPKQLQDNPALHHEILIRSAPHTFAAHMSGGKWTPARHVTYLGQRIAMGIAQANADRAAGIRHIGYRAIINLPPRYGKPVDVNSIVLMGDGSRRRIGDLVVGDVVISHTGTPRRVLNIYEQGELECVQIETDSGRRTAAATTHPFLTTEGWKNASDLVPGTVLALVPNPQTTGESSRSISEFIMAGYFLGDGSTAVNQDGASCSCNVTNVDPEIIEDMCHQAALLDWQVTQRGITYYFRNPGYSHTVGPRQWLKNSEGLIGKSGTKRVPEWVFRSSKAQISAFVGAYFACDGSVSSRGHSIKRKIKRIDVAVEFYSINLQILQDVRHLLLRLGVRSRIAVKNGTYKGAKHVSYRLTITSMEDVMTFRENIRVVGQKVKRLSEWPLVRKQFRPYFLPDAVTANTPVGLRQCRCLTVETDSTFTSDDFVVHNTLFVSKWLPTWFLDNWPDQKVMMCSYGSDLAIDSGRTVRDEFESNPLLRTRLREDDRAAGTWKTVEGGGMKCEGIGGGIVGFGFSLGIIDDVLKDAEEAYSPVVRLKCIEWFKSTFYYRKEPGAHIIVLGHRWHSDDLFGWLMKCHPDPWEVIPMPAIAKANDILGRQPGEALWPERWPLQEVLAVRAADPIWFDAMHQQEPPNERGDRVYSHYTAAENLVNASDPPAYNATRKDLPLCLTMDFNVNPGMHALILQCDYKADMIVVHDEIHGVRLKTEGTMEAFGKWLDANGAPQGTFPWPHLYIYGDRSGKTQNTVTSLTDYDVIRNWCDARGIPTKIYVPAKNPPVKDRVDTVNTALKDENGVVHVKVHARCARLEEDLSTQPNDIDGQPDKSDQRLGHAGDAFGYSAYWMRPIRRVKFQPQRAVY